MEFLSETHLNRFKYDLSKIYKEEIKAKIKNFKQTFKENDYIILKQTSYINKNLADLQIIKNKNFDADQTRCICDEIAIEQYVESISQSIEHTKTDGKHQHKYALYKMLDRYYNITYIIIPYKIAKELPNDETLQHAIDYNNSDKQMRNVKINVNHASEEIKKIFLGILLNTEWDIAQPTTKTFTFLYNPAHTPTITNGYLSLHLNDNSKIVLLDEANNIIDPELYVPLDLFDTCKNRTRLEDLE